ncbi:hypothetical protein OE749_10370 [Aestuariibacter sp. AA17]|uniref:Uncharacterized protein n=1 Tax=Fluctibacter corallii TaxID=2984329 RepID=A0ABT3A909_9ALTE|nr:hypothetical protein [Aestuariibacter sp. AA17]MCV2885095.1 hypothetical protein [Aestuariibacter sp. AA17]
MEVESSLVAAQNGLAISPSQPEPQRQAEAQQQQAQRQQTELPRTQVVVRQADSEASEQADRFRQQQRTTYEQPDARSRSAINAYQALELEERRSEIKSLFGVDTYA